MRFGYKCCDLAKIHKLSLRNNSQQIRRMKANMRSFLFLVHVFAVIEIFAYGVDGELDILKRHQQLQVLILR